MKNPSYSQHAILLKVLLFGLAFSVLHIALERGLSFAASDVALMGWIRILNISIILCDAVGFFIGYAFLQTLAVLFGKKTAFSALLLLTAVSVFRHIGNWIAFLITENVTSAIDLRLSLLAAFGSLTIEMAQNGAIFLLSILLLKQDDSVHQKTLTASIIVSAVMLVINLVSRIISDVEYGAPSSSAEVWVMVAYYLFDILLYGAIGLFLTRLLIRSEAKKCAE